MTKFEKFMLASMILSVVLTFMYSEDAIVVLYKIQFLVSSILFVFTKGEEDD